MILSGTLGVFRISRRHNKYAMRPIITRPARPPTTIPAMAPALMELFDVTGTGDAVAIAIEIVVVVVRVVWAPPAGRMVMDAEVMVGAAVVVVD